MRNPFASITATADELAADRAGDDIVLNPDVVMDRAFSLEASPERVWPWLVQLGKRRAGWYLPHSLERLLPPTRRAVRTIAPQWQELGVGDVIPDYGGRHETFDVVQIHPPRTLVYRSTRGTVHLSWSLTLTPIESAAIRSGTRLHLRLRLGPVRRIRLARTIGGLFDAATIAGLAAGLRERLAPANQ